MPDLITHCLISRILFFRKFKKYLLVFLSGAILPDVLTRAPLFFLSECYHCSWWIGILHSPLPLIFIVLLISLFFKKVRATFVALFLGVALHLFLDSFQRHWGGGYYWLFPFSFQTAEWGLLWPETSINFIPYLLLVAILVYAFELYLIGRKIRKNSKNFQSSSTNFQ